MPKIYKIMFIVSLLLTLLAVGALFAYGLRTGVDFTGGSILEISFLNDRPAISEINKIASAVSGVSDLVVSPVDDKGAILRMRQIDNSTASAITNALSAEFGNVRQDRFDSISASIGDELKTKSLIALGVLLLAVVTYISIVFRKLGSILSPWIMGLASVIALAHDVLLPMGLFAVLGHYMNVEISAIFVAAALTILGYSISDTVVIFDRVRENVLRFGSKQGFGQIVHTSVMQTLTRSLNTTLTTLLSLLAIFFFGGESIRYFALALIVGIFSGAYSSIFVASPVLVWFSGHRQARR